MRRPSAQTRGAAIVRASPSPFRTDRRRAAALSRDAPRSFARLNSWRAAHALDRELGSGPDVHLPRARVRLRLLVEVDGGGGFLWAPDLRSRDTESTATFSVIRAGAALAPATMVTPGAKGFAVTSERRRVHARSMFAVATIARAVGSKWSRHGGAGALYARLHSPFTQPEGCARPARPRGVRVSLLRASSERGFRRRRTCSTERPIGVLVVGRVQRRRPDADCKAAGCLAFSFPFSAQRSALRRRRRGGHGARACHARPSTAARARRLGGAPAPIGAPIAAAAR